MNTTEALEGADAAAGASPARSYLCACGVRVFMCMCVSACVLVCPYVRVFICRKVCVCESACVYLVVVWLLSLYAWSECACYRVLIRVSVCGSECASVQVGVFHACCR